MIVGDGLCHIAHTSAAAAPGRLHHASAVLLHSRQCLVFRSAVTAFANYAGIGVVKQRQQMFGCKTAAAHVAYLGKAFVGRQQMFERRVGTQQLLLYGAVPSPWCNLQVVAHVGRYVLKVGWCDESYVVGVALHVAHPFECSLYVVYQYHVTIVCPQRRQKSKVGAQLASGMRGCKTGLIGRKGNVVFGIEYMEFHFF